MNVEEGKSERRWEILNTIARKEDICCFIVGKPWKVTEIGVFLTNATLKVVQPSGRQALGRFSLILPIIRLNMGYFLLGKLLGRSIQIQEAKQTILHCEYEQASLFTSA